MSGPGAGPAACARPRRTPGVTPGMSGSTSPSSSPASPPARSTAWRPWGWCSATRRRASSTSPTARSPPAPPTSSSTLHVEHGLAWPLAGAICVLGAAPLFGLVLERMARCLADVPPVRRVVATVGLLLTITSTLTLIYGAGGSGRHAAVPAPGPVLGRRHPRRVLPGDRGADLGDRRRSACSCFFRSTRLGVAMRGVVDDPALLALSGTSPVRVRSAAWIISSCFAAVSGILIAPVLGLDALLLTLLVVEAFGAAAIGRFSSLPLTYAGGLVVGLLASLSRKFLVGFDGVVGVPPSMPFLVLFAVLLLIPKPKLVQAGVRVRTAGARERTPLARPSGWAASGRAGGAAGRPRTGRRQAAGLHRRRHLRHHVPVAGLLVWTSGQVSLCHAAFAGVGAAAMFGHFTTGLGLPWARRPAPDRRWSTVPVGALVAIPAIRLSGLYLALATFGFGILLQRLLLPRVHVRRRRQQRRAPAGCRVARRRDTGYFYVVRWPSWCWPALLVWAVSAAGSGSCSCGPGRLAARPWPPWARRINVTRVLVFCISAFLAGVAGGALRRARSDRSSSFGVRAVRVAHLARRSSPWPGRRSSSPPSWPPALLAVGPAYVPAARSSTRPAPSGSWPWPCRSSCRSVRPAGPAAAGGRRSAPAAGGDRRCRARRLRRTRTDRPTGGGRHEPERRRARADRREPHRPLRRRRGRRRPVARRAARAAHRPHRPERRRQDHHVQRLHRAAAPDRGPGPPVRHRTSPTRSAGPGPPRPGPDVPAHGAVRLADRGRERRASAGRRPRRAQPAPPAVLHPDERQTIAAAVDRGARACAASAIWPGAGPGRCPPASAAWSSWPGPSPATSVPAPRRAVVGPRPQRDRGLRPDPAQRGRRARHRHPARRARHGPRHEVCDHIYVLDFGQLIFEGDPGRRADQRRRPGRLPRCGGRRCLSCAGHPRPGYGDTAVLRDVSTSPSRRRRWWRCSAPTAPARPPCCGSPPGCCRLARGSPPRRRRTSPGCRAHGLAGAGICHVPEGRGVFPASPCGRTCCCRPSRARRRRPRAGHLAFPGPRRAARPAGRDHERRRAADAGAGPGLRVADPRSSCSTRSRWASPPRSSTRSSSSWTAEGRRGLAAARRAVRHARPSRSPTTSTSSTRAK